MILHSNEWPYLLPETERSVVAAYGLWMLWGLFGVHRAYLGKYRSALVFLFTFGLLGWGWLYDLITLPKQVARCNLRILAARSRRAGPWRGQAAAAPRRGDAMQALLASAAQHNGTLTVTEGVLATGLPFHKVQATLREMVGSGYVDVRNHPETGVVQYVFPELVRGNPTPRPDAREARPA